MTSNFGSSLWITLIGMGLVFIAILLLWVLMEAVVRLTARNNHAEEAKNASASESETLAMTASSADRKIRAAAAAVAFALAHKSAASSPNLPPTANGSAWQAVTRSFQLNNRGQMTNRKSRGK